MKRCDKCQRFAAIQHQPSTELTPIVSPWPFMQWGLDVLGPFPPASSQRRFILVAVHYFTKWIKTEALATTTEKFGLPKALVTDNGRQFDNPKFKEWCESISIDLRFTSVKQPQTNGQAEAANKNILQALKKRLDKAKGAWADELSGVLWALKTTTKVPTGETPFKLAFGTEAVVPGEIGMPNFRVELSNETENEEALRANLYLTEE